MDVAFPEPEPAPVTTIARRVAHVLVGVFGTRMAGQHFGGPEVDYFTYDYPGTADEAHERLGIAVRDAPVAGPVPRGTDVRRVSASEWS